MYIFKLVRGEGLFNESLCRRCFLSIQLRREPVIQGLYSFWVAIVLVLTWQVLKYVFCLFALKKLNFSLMYISSWKKTSYLEGSFGSSCMFFSDWFQNELFLNVTYPSSQIEYTTKCSLVIPITSLKNPRKKSFL